MLRHLRARRGGLMGAMIRCRIFSARLNFAARLCTSDRRKLFVVKLPRGWGVSVRKKTLGWQSRPLTLIVLAYHFAQLTIHATVQPGTESLSLGTQS